MGWPPANHPVINRCHTAEGGKRRTSSVVFITVVLTALFPGSLWPGDHSTAKVAYVIDGDTVILNSGERVRLLGINTPEIAHKKTWGEPLGEEARQELIRLVDNKTVSIEPGIESRDRYGRLLAHLTSSDGKSIEATLLEQGLAAVVVIPPNVDHLPEFTRVEEQARKAKRGLWGLPYFEPRSADALNDSDQGFRRVRGRVVRVASTKKSISLQLSDRFSITIHRQEWERYWQGHPEQYLHQWVTVRGWLISSGRGWRVNIGHPAMLHLNPS